MPDLKEKLVELLDNFNRNLSPFAGDSRYFMVDDNIEQAEYLIANGVTLQEWISVEAGELQNYIGVPVCIKRKTDGERWWAIIRGIKGNKVSTDYGGYFLLSEYGKTWIVKYLPLPQPPKGE